MTKQAIDEQNKPLESRSPIGDKPVLNLEDLRIGCSSTADLNDSASSKKFVISNIDYETKTVYLENV